MTPTQTAHREHEEPAQFLGIEIEREQVIPYWKGETTLPTQTGHRQDDKESVQFPADAEKESVFTIIDPDETTPDAVKVPYTITPDPDLVRDDADTDAPATQTGRRQNQPKSVLTDEIKAFIVRGLARYEAPTRVAASVQVQFGVTVDRRQVYAYDPAGARPPAKRWIDLHKATRAKFMRAASEIGVAQKVVRLRMLDRFANRAEEGNYTDRAAKYLEQAAKECGGFYERYARPKGAAAPSN